MFNIGFKSSGVPILYYIFVQALPTEPAASGSTVTQSVDGLQNEKKSLDTEIAKDEAELKA
jgi:hypothetical protein